MPEADARTAYVEYCPEPWVRTACRRLLASWGRVNTGPVHGGLARSLGEDVDGASAQAALGRRELRVQQAAQHQLRLPRTGTARDLSDPLHVDAATHHTVEHRTAERELPSVADVVVKSMRGDGEGRAASSHFPRASAETRAQLARSFAVGGFLPPRRSAR